MARSSSHIVGALIVALISAVVIFVKFNQIPAHLTWDEVEFARLAVSLGERGYTPYSEYATGHATPYFYIILASFKLFGLHEGALRFPAALFGVLASVALYFILRLVFERGSLTFAIPGRKRHVEIETALLLTVIFITMRWYFGFARFSFEATLVLLLELVSLYGILNFIRQPKKTMWLILSALFAGLAFNSYQPGRFFAVVPVLALFLHKDTRSWKNLLIFGGVFGILITPLSVYLSQHPDIRVKQQLYLQDETRTAMEKFGFFLDNVWRNTKLFFIEGDASGRHNYPFKAALNPILGILSLVGFVQALRTFRKPITLLFLLYFAIAMGPTLLTYPHENPNMLRTVTVIPAIIYFVGLGIAGLAELAHKLDKKRLIGAYFGTILLLLITVSSILELRTYFVFQRAIFDQAFEVTDRFGGVYFYMKKNHIDINKFRIPEDQIQKFYSVPGPEQTYRNQ
jgi:4-amino-4-deoxy-L-arabinose transferase-like glycosyltransferase